MLAVKQEAQKIIQNLPDNCTYEDIQYHLYVVKKIKNGISRAENAEPSSHQDAKSVISKFFEKVEILQEFSELGRRVPELNDIKLMRYSFTA